MYFSVNSGAYHQMPTTTSFAMHQQQVHHHSSVHQQQQQHQIVQKRPQAALGSQNYIAQTYLMPNRCQQNVPSYAGSHQQSAYRPYKTHQQRTQPVVVEPDCDMKQGMRDVPVWLKSLRLHKYKQLFTTLEYEEMLALTEHILEEKGVTKGARHKIIVNIEKLRDRQDNVRSLFKCIDQEGISAVRQALNELKTILITPIKAYGGWQPPQSDPSLLANRGSCSADSGICMEEPEDDHQTEPEDSVPTSKRQQADAEASETANEGDLPGEIFRLVVKLFRSLQFESLRDEECLNLFLVVTDKMVQHEAFTADHKKNLIKWKQQIEKLKQIHHQNRYQERKYNAGRWNQNVPINSCNVSNVNNLGNLSNLNHQKQISRPNASVQALSAMPPQVNNLADNINSEVIPLSEVNYCQSARDMHNSSPDQAFMTPQEEQLVKMNLVACNNSIGFGQVSGNNSTNNGNTNGYNPQQFADAVETESTKEQANTYSEPNEEELFPVNKQQFLSTIEDSSIFGLVSDIGKHTLESSQLTNYESVRNLINLTNSLNSYYKMYNAGNMDNEYNPFRTGANVRPELASSKPEAFECDQIYSHMESLSLRMTEQALGLDDMSF